MKVLYVNLGGPLLAGSEQILLDLIANLGAEVQACVLCNSAAMAQAACRMGHQAVACSAMEELSHWTTPPWNWRGLGAGLKAAIRCVDNFRPDLLHANNVWPTQVAVLAGLARHRPVVTHIRAETIRSGRELSLARLSDHLIACSSAVAAPFRTMRWRRGAISVVYDPATAVNVGPSPPKDPGRPVQLAVVSRLSEEKAVHRAINLMAWLRRERLSAALTVYGDGPQRAALESQAARLDLGGIVTFAGFCPDIPRRLRDADVLLTCSIREALPRVIAEAALVGAASIAVAVGGNPEAMIDGRTGRLVEDFESEPCRRAILELLRDRPRLEEMGRQARTFCRERFDPARSARAVLDIYRQVLHRGRRRGESPEHEMP